jgi:MscS family membrane protein
MKAYIEQLWRQIFLDPGTIIDSGLRIFGIIIMAAVIWWVLNWIIGKLEKKYKDRLFVEKGDRLFVLVKRAGHYTILILVAIALLRAFNAPVVEKIFYAFMILLISSFANSFAVTIIPFMEEKFVKKTSTKFDDVLIGLGKKFSGIIIYTTGIILALDVLGMNIMPFIAGASVAGIAIGFAAKDTLSNLIAGVLLIIDRPFEVGDRIEVWTAPVNSATWGDVIDIGLRATKIKTTDNIVIIIPNNEIMRRDIINYTSISKEIRVRIPIGIAYDADVRKAKEIIKRVSLELDWVMKDPPPKVVVKNFGESAVNLEARVWISKPRKRIDTISHVTDRTKEVFQQEGIEIPFPKRDIYIKRERR